MVGEKETFYGCLENGIRVVFHHNNSSILYCGIAIGTGTRDEQEPNIFGMAHFIEHTLFKGTTHRSARQIINRIEDVGGEINAYTTKEETFFYAAVLPQYMQRATELMADMLCYPSFPDKELRKEREVIYDEIESYNDSPSDLIYDDFEALMFKNHSLEHPILGSRRTLRYMNGNKAHRFMAEKYNTDHIVFFVQGNTTMSKVMKIAQRYLSDTPFKQRDYKREMPNEYTAQQAIYRKHTHQTHVMLGNRAYPILHPKQNTLFLLNNIVGGGGMKSMLNLSLREQRGLVYTVESTYTPLSDCGYWAVYYACEPDNTQLCEDLIYIQLRQLCNKPLSASALQKYKRQLIGQMSVSNENQENSALAMAKYMLYYNYAPTLEDIFKQINDISAEQIQDVAREIFDISKFSILKYQ